MSDLVSPAHEAGDLKSMLGPVQLQSRHTFTNTVARLKEAITSGGLHLVADIDHSAAAEDVELHMPPTRLFIFGNPTAGTPVMLCSPAAAIDLPLKVLVREEGTTVWLSYDRPEYWGLRHGIPDILMDKLRGIASLCQEVAG